MRVLHLIDHLGLGGSQSVLLDLLEIRSMDVVPSVWALRARTLAATRDRLAAAGVRPRDLNLSPRNPLGLLQLRRGLAREQPDVLHTRLDFSNLFGPPAALSLGRSRPRIVVTVENDPYQHYHAIPRAGLRLLSSRVDALVIVSESLREAVGPLIRGARRVDVISPGVDRDRFRRQRADPVEVRRLRGGASRVIGSVGRLAEQKGHEILLAATKLLLESDRSTRVLLVGEGPRRADLERLAGSLGVKDAVHFVGYRKDVATAYAAMDVFVLPSWHEGFAIVCAEAMAMGVPVVATRVVGTVDAVKDGVSGVLVPPGEATALARAILRLMSNPAMRAEMGRKGAEWVAKRCCREETVARTEALYRDLCKT